MIGWQITDTDFGIGALVVVILAVLVYRIFRKEPLDRLVRLGVFIERARIKDEPRPEQPAVHHIDPSDVNTEIVWPKREEADDPQGDA